MLTQRTARGCYMTFPLICTSKWWLSTAVGTTIMVETSVGSEFISPPCQSTIMWSRGLKTTIWEQHWGLWFKPVTLYCTWCSCPVTCILITLYYPQKFEIWKSFHSTVGVIIFLIFLFYFLFFQKGLCLICASAIFRNFNICFLQCWWNLPKLIREVLASFAQQWCRCWILIS